VQAKNANGRKALPDHDLLWTFRARWRAGFIPRSEIIQPISPRSIDTPETSFSAIEFALTLAGIAKAVGAPAPELLTAEREVQLGDVAPKVSVAVSLPCRKVREVQIFASDLESSGESRCTCCQF
jgi:hypothetical protein